MTRSMNQRGARRLNQAIRAAAVGVAAVLVLTGCGAPMSDEELLTQARDANFEFKAAVAQVQLQLVDDDWRLTEYGAAPRACESASGQYSYQQTRDFPPTSDTGDEWEGWHLDEDPLDTVARVGAWLEENGWTDIRHRTYSEKVDNVVLQAKNEDAGVDRLDIDINPGNRYDRVTIMAYSTCHPGDQRRLWELLNPYDTLTYSPLTELSPSEHPSTRPYFGLTPERAHIYWPDEWEAALKAAE